MSENTPPESNPKRRLRHPFFEITLGATIVGVFLISAILLIPTTFPYRDFGLIVGGAFLGAGFLAADEYFDRSVERATDQMERSEASRERDKAEEERRKAEFERNSLRERASTLQAEIAKLQASTSTSMSALEQLTQTTDDPAIRTAGSLGFLVAMQIQQNMGTTEQVISLAKSLGVKDEILSAVSLEWRLRVLRDEVLSTSGTGPPLIPLVPNDEGVGPHTKIEFAKMIPDVFLQEVESQIFQTKGSLVRSAFAVSWNTFALAYLLQGGSLAMGKDGIEVGLDRKTIKGFESMRKDSIVKGFADLGFPTPFQHSVDESLNWLIENDDPSTAWTYCNTLFALFFRFKINMQQFNHLQKFLEEHSSGQPSFKEDFQLFELENGLYGVSVPPVRPANSKFYADKAHTLWKEKRYDEAAAEYDEAIRFDPKESKYHFAKGTIYLELGSYQNAVTELGSATELNPSVVIYHEYLGKALFELKRYDEAIAEYDAQAKLDPTDYSPHFDKSRAFFDQGKYQEAIAECDLAIKLNPSDPHCHNNKAVALSSLEHYEDAVAEWDLAIGLDPSASAFHYNKAIALAKLGRDEEAAAERGKADSLQSGQP